MLCVQRIVRHCIAVPSVNRIRLLTTGTLDSVQHLTQQGREGFTSDSVKTWTPDKVKDWAVHTVGLKAEHADKLLMNEITGEMTHVIAF